MVEIDKATALLAIQMLEKLKEKGTLDDNDYKEIAGDLDIGKGVRDILLQKGCCGHRGYGVIVHNEKTDIAIKSELFKKIIYKVEQEEYERKIDMESKITSIKYARKAYRQSWVAIIVSIITIITTFLLQLL